MPERDAVIVGARCAGSSLAISLARNGWDVTVVDRDEFPSHTISTNLIFPNTLARMQELGVLQTLLATHDVPMLGFRIVGFGYENAGHFSSIDGFDSLISPRRIALDQAMVETALAAGVEGRFGERVVDLIGTGTAGDPVSGVVLEGGETIRAKWVFGADGRASTIAGKLGIEKTNPLQGEVSYLLAFWKGIPNDGFATSEIRSDEILSSWAAEDGHHLLTAWGDAEFTRGSKDELLDRYLDFLTRFPDTVDPDALAAAEMTSPLIVAPETLMRGYFREATGPGWALLGDACHFKHPGTGQGIGDAVEQAVQLAASVTGDDPNLERYSDWLEKRSAQQYPWSYAWGRFPPVDGQFKGWAAEPDAAQDLRDSFSRLVKPSDVLSKERLKRWFSPAAAS
jgi:2-polyprenyl-6-methoxyphenol hydroxylase-like FAD-dependent oxidoreductase